MLEKEKKKLKNRRKKIRFDSKNLGSMSEKGFEKYKNRLLEEKFKNMDSEKKIRIASKILSKEEIKSILDDKKKV